MPMLFALRHELMCRR